MGDMGRTSGRYRKSEEDKAKQVPLKLTSDYIEKLNYLPGKNVAEKVRNLIDSSCDFYERERRQLKEVERLIPSLHRLALSLVDPDLKEDRTKWENEKSRFLSSLHSLESLIEILHLDFKTLKSGLKETSYKNLEVIFFVKNSLS